MIERKGGTPRKRHEQQQKNSTLTSIHLYTVHHDVHAVGFWGSSQAIIYYVHFNMYVYTYR